MKKKQINQTSLDHRWRQCEQNDYEIPYYQHQPVSWGHAQNRNKNTKKERNKPLQSGPLSLNRTRVLRPASMRGSIWSKLFTCRADVEAWKWDATRKTCIGPENNTHDQKKESWWSLELHMHKLNKTVLSRKAAFCRKMTPRERQWENEKLILTPLSCERNLQLQKRMHLTITIYTHMYMTKTNHIARLSRAACLLRNRQTCYCQVWKPGAETRSLNVNGTSDHGFWKQTSRWIAVA